MRARARRSQKLRFIGNDNVIPTLLARWLVDFGQISAFVPIDDVQMTLFVRSFRNSLRLYLALNISPIFHTIFFVPTFVYLFLWAIVANLSYRQNKRNNNNFIILFAVAKTIHWRKEEKINNNILDIIVWMHLFPQSMVKVIENRDAIFLRVFKFQIYINFFFFSVPSHEILIQLILRWNNSNLYS